MRKGIQVEKIEYNPCDGHQQQKDCNPEQQALQGYWKRITQFFQHSAKVRNLFEVVVVFVLLKNR